MSDNPTNEVIHPSARNQNGGVRIVLPTKRQQSPPDNDDDTGGDSSSRGIDTGSEEEYKKGPAANQAAVAFRPPESRFPPGEVRTGSDCNGRGPYCVTTSISSGQSSSNYSGSATEGNNTSTSAAGTSSSGSGGSCRGSTEGDEVQSSLDGSTSDSSSGGATPGMKKGKVQQEQQQETPKHGLVGETQETSSGANEGQSSSLGDGTTSDSDSDGPPKKKAKVQKGGTDEAHHEGAWPSAIYPKKKSRSDEAQRVSSSDAWPTHRKKSKKHAKQQKLPAHRAESHSASQLSKHPRPRPSSSLSDKSASSAGVPPKDKFVFVQSFLSALRATVKHHSKVLTEEEKEALQKKKQEMLERKRIVNRRSAKKKRESERELIETLGKKAHDLRVVNQVIRSDTDQLRTLLSTVRDLLKSRKIVPTSVPAAPTASPQLNDMILRLQQGLVQPSAPVAGDAVARAAASLLGRTEIPAQSSASAFPQHQAGVSFPCLPQQQTQQAEQPSQSALLALVLLMSNPNLPQQLGQLLLQLQQATTNTTAVPRAPNDLLQAFLQQAPVPVPPPSAPEPVQPGPQALLSLLLSNSGMSQQQQPPPMPQPAVGQNDPSRLMALLAQRGNNAPPPAAGAAPSADQLQQLISQIMSRRGSS